MWYISSMRILRAFFLAFALVCLLQAAKTLDIYSIDVEGGQATLIVTPSGDSMLVDAGWPGFNGRDAGRIQAAAQLAHVKQIDYLLVTHYHADHVGGVPQLVEKIPVVHFVDHGPNMETNPAVEQLYDAYMKLAAKGKHLVVKPGDRIPLRGAKVEVLTAAGAVISSPLKVKGAGKENPECASAERKPEDPTENARSTGFLLTFGKFRFIDLGDLTWNTELDLACPVNKIGTVDAYLVTHHGMNISNSPSLVRALRPKVAIMNNGAKKGGSPEAWQVFRHSPDLRDLWQLHFAVAGGKENNSPEDFIANPGESDAGYGIKLSAEQTGEFTVTNLRNGFKKTYQ
jgi:beta-lactamase superfamily II metal-dependent hydrolase